MECSKRFIDEQYFRVSSLSGSSFLSYLPIRVTRFYRALYDNAILVFPGRKPLWRPEINKNIWNSICDVSAYYPHVSRTISYVF